MNYQSTLKALKNKYPNTHNNVLLCLFKKYYPAITSSIMDQLKIDSSSLKECPVIYNDLGIPDGFNADDPIEISPIFLQRYVDSLIMKYNMIDDKYKKRKHLHTVLKPMLIKGASPDFTDEDIEDKPVDPEEFYTRNKDNINDLLVKIYNNSSELETLKLSNEEMQLVNFIDMYYFGLSNAFYFSDLLKNIYNELLRISKENNTFIEECYYIFKNTLYSKIKSKQYPSNKIDNIERDYKILPTNLKQSYKRKNNMQLKNYKEQKVSNMSLNKHLQIKLNISPREAQIIESVAKEYLLEEEDYKPAFVNFMNSNLKNFKNELIDHIQAGSADKFWEINLTLTPEIFDMLQKFNAKTKNIASIKGLEGKVKLDTPYVIQFYWIDLVNFLVNYKNNSDFLDKASFDKIGFDNNTLYALYKMIGNPVGNLKGYDPSEGRLKKETNLKNYLHKRLTISEKEATLIESAVRQYVQNSKRKK